MWGVPEIPLPLVPSLVGTWCERGLWFTLLMKRWQVRPAHTPSALIGRLVLMAIITLRLSIRKVQSMPRHLSWCTLCPHPTTEFYFKRERKKQTSVYVFACVCSLFQLIRVGAAQPCCGHCWEDSNYRARPPQQRTHTRRLDLLCQRSEVQIASRHHSLTAQREWAWPR